MKKSLLLICGLLICGCSVSNASSTNKNSSNSSSSVSQNISSPNSQSSNSDLKEGYIYTENDLKKIANDLTGTYYLANDITLTSTWSTIGDDDNPFKGTINGNGYSIINLEIKDSLSITNKTATSGIEYTSVGGFIGVNKGIITDLNIVNYSINLENQTLNTSASSSSEYKIFVGGLVGINKGTITNCSTSGTANVKSTSTIARGRVGGLAGKNEDTITNCSTSGNLTATLANENIRIGGLVGASEDGTISKCYSSTNVTATNTNGKVLAGGLIGQVEFATITNCYATGNITSTSYKASNAGGLVGFIDATIEGTTIISSSYASGKVNATATAKSSYAGGLIGSCEVLISNNKLVGEVVISSCFYGGNSIVSNAANKAHGGMVISCIEGNTSDNTIDIEDCYYLKGVSTQIKGTSESKKNDNGDEVSSISILLTSLNWDSSIWELSSTSTLPTLK